MESPNPQRLDHLIEIFNFPPPLPRDPSALGGSEKPGANFEHQKTRKWMLSKERNAQRARKTRKINMSGTQKSIIAPAADEPIAFDGSRRDCCCCTQLGVAQGKESRRMIDGRRKTEKRLPFYLFHAPQSNIRSAISFLEGRKFSLYRYASSIRAESISPFALQTKTPTADTTAPVMVPCTNANGSRQEKIRRWMTATKRY